MSICDDPSNSFLTYSDISETDIQSVELSKLKQLFVKKANKIARIGRYILVSCENGIFKIYDLFSLTASPVEEYHDIKLSFRDFCWEIENDKPTIYVHCIQNDEKNPKANLGVIEMKTQVNEISNPIDILQHAFSTFSRFTMTAELEATVREEIDTLATNFRDLNDNVPIPFAIIQEMIFSLDDYTFALSKQGKAKNLNMQLLHLKY